MGGKGEKGRSDGEELRDVAGGMREIFSTLNEFLPKFLNELFGSMVSGADAAQLADDVARFYKNLVDSGMDKEQAYELTKSFMAGRDKGAMIMQVLTNLGSFMKSPFGKEVKVKIKKHHHKHDDEDEKEDEERVVEDSERESEKERNAYTEHKLTKKKKREYEEDEEDEDVRRKTNF
ncbi:MAG: hypothetical protein N2234_06215 [Planctomycetota bacterium]|nr:hypothetical protein [Planctomycetota bacterium]